MICEDPLAREARLEAREALIQRVLVDHPVLDHDADLVTLEGLEVLADAFCDVLKVLITVLFALFNLLNEVVGLHHNLDWVNFDNVASKLLFVR